MVLLGPGALRRRHRVLLSLVGLAACTTATSTPPASGPPAEAGTLDADVSSDAAIRPDARVDSLDAGEDAAGDPWNPPLDGPVVGVATFDGWETPRRLPPPVNIDGGWTDSVMITADARRLLFGYTTTDFDTLLSTGTFSYTGTRRPGMPVDDFRIFEATLERDAWRVGYHPIGSGDPNYAEASASVNVAQDLMVFTRWAHDAGFKADLFFASRSSNGWSTPAPLAINTACNDDNGFVVGDLATGVTLYFESDRIDDAGTSCGSKKHLFTTTYASGTFSPVVRAPGMNGTGVDDEDFQPFVSPDQKTAVWSAIRTSPAFYGILTAERTDTSAPFGAARPLLGVTTFAPPFANRITFLGEANVAEVPQGWVMTLMCGGARRDNDAGTPADVHLDVCFSRKAR